MVKPTTKPQRDRDEQVLIMLYCADVCGMNYRQIAEHVGVSRGAVAGAIDRVRKADEAIEHLDSQDGTMKPLWWLTPGR